ncbi:hypothetical protein F2P81_015343 [Scophthalmus maximus]|uniref:Uncharacterized protein n=1 Tax=Scophthalmus maximus TaxID=52904 RepID=A0A6A4SFZ4_SCOMX|nr:hypothetical protein F2P81_015343 [Scophthalmus maximus]
MTASSSPDRYSPSGRKTKGSHHKVQLKKANFPNASLKWEEGLLWRATYQIQTFLREEDRVLGSTVSVECSRMTCDGVQKKSDC